MISLSLQDVDNNENEIVRVDESLRRVMTFKTMVGYFRLSSRYALIRTHFILLLSNSSSCLILVAHRLKVLGH